MQCKKTRRAKQSIAAQSSTKPSGQKIPDDNNTNKQDVTKRKRETQMQTDRYDDNMAVTWMDGRQVGS